MPVIFTKKWMHMIVTRECKAAYERPTQPKLTIPHPINIDIQINIINTFYESTTMCRIMSIIFGNSVQCASTQIFEKIKFTQMQQHNIP